MFNNLFRLSITFLVLIHLPSFARFYTLDQLIEETVKNSTVLKIAKKEIEHSELELQKVTSHFYPKISSSLHAAHLFDWNTPQKFCFENGFAPGMVVSKTDIRETIYADPEITPSSMPAENTASGSEWPISEYVIPALNIHQTVFAQGKEYYKLKSGRALQHIKVCHYEELKQREIAETKKRYYKVLLEQERIAILKKHLSLLKEIHRQKCLGISLGENYAIDTLYSRLEIQNGILEIYQAQSEKNKALETLAMKCGISDRPSSLWFDDKMPEPVFFITIEEAVTQMYEMNSTLRQLKGYENITQNKVKMSKSEYLPKIGMGAFFGICYPVSERNGNFKVLDSENYSALYAQLRWDLFSGLETKRNIELAKNELAQFQLRERSDADSLELETRRQFHEISLAQKKLSLIRNIIRASGKMLEEEKMKLKNGIVTSLAVQQAEFAVQKEKLRYVEQLYLFHCTLINFRFLIGSPV